MQSMYLTAHDLKLAMLDAQDVQRTILQETLDSAEYGNLLESGRTMCPLNDNEIRMPVNRQSRSVELQSCPAGPIGIMHTHVSVPQLKRPEHSLPDMGNVLLERVDASVVVGTQHHEALSVGDPDSDREAFQDALGLSVTSTNEVVDAIISGRIPDPTDARQRVRDRLPQQFERVPSAFADLDRRVDALASRGSIPAYETVQASADQAMAIKASIVNTYEPSRTSTITGYTRQMRAQRRRLARQTTDGGFFPPIQISSTGNPISIVDFMVRGAVVSAVIVGVAYTGGFLPVPTPV